MKKQNLGRDSFPEMYSPLDAQKPKKEIGPANDFGFPDYKVEDPLDLIPDGE